MELYHEQCREKIAIDISNCVYLMSPTIGYDPVNKGVTVAIAEIRIKDPTNVKYVCTTCKEFVSTDKIMARCEICEQMFNCPTLYYSRHFGPVCTNCAELFKNESVLLNNEITQKIENLKSIYPQSAFEFSRIEEILHKFILK